jgi:hypothetical protein
LGRILVELKSSPIPPKPEKVEPKNPFLIQIFALNLDIFFCFGKTNIDNNLREQIENFQRNTNKANKLWRNANWRETVWLFVGDVRSFWFDFYWVWPQTIIIGKMVFAKLKNFFAKLIFFPPKFFLLRKISLF